jgi:hypothetical protein
MHDLLILHAMFGSQFVMADICQKQDILTVHSLYPRTTSPIDFNPFLGGSNVRMYDAALTGTRHLLIMIGDCYNWTTLAYLVNSSIILVGEDLDYLDGEHCVFGEIVDGWDTVDKMNNTICDGSKRPYQVRFMRIYGVEN